MSEESTESQEQSSVGRLQVDMDLYVLFKLGLRGYEAIARRQAKLTPLTTLEVGEMQKLINGFEMILKHALRVCHDNRAFCKYRKGVCVFTPEELRARPKLILSCEQRGARRKT